jgi:hypothetical protein
MCLGDAPDVQGKETFTAAYALESTKARVVSPRKKPLYDTKTHSLSFEVDTCCSTLYDIS